VADVEVHQQGAGVEQFDCGLGRRAVHGGLGRNGDGAGGAACHHIASSRRVRGAGALCDQPFFGPSRQGLVRDRNRSWRSRVCPKVRVAPLTGAAAGADWASREESSSLEDSAGRRSAPSAAACLPASAGSARQRRFHGLGYRPAQGSGWGQSHVDRRGRGCRAFLPERATALVAAVRVIRRHRCVGGSCDRTRVAPPACPTRRPMPRRHAGSSLHHHRDRADPQPSAHRSRN